MTEYSTYQFTKKEWVLESGKILAVLTMTGLLFFNHVLGVLLLLPYGAVMLKERKEVLQRNRINQLREDFKEFIASFASSVQAGYTMEQAVLISYDDLYRLYGNGERSLLRELNLMKGQLQLRIPCEVLFSDLAERSGVEEIRSFAVVMNVGRRQGGNLVQITRRTVENISKKLQVEMEVEQVIAGRMMEKKIMFFMPYFMLFYLRLTNGSYMEVMYQGVLGRLVLLVCLILLWISEKWADRIVKIQV